MRKLSLQSKLKELKKELRYMLTYKKINWNNFKKLVEEAAHIDEFLVHLNNLNTHRSGAPPDAQVYINPIYYKIGVHNKVFMWDGYEWVKSEKSLKVINRAILNRGIGK